ncbi:hypothetical protein SSX86_013220 [Deinandra increscens subsp. villosa]|uniref:Agenet domain-containing protein n=1 Tax=Deinandra increscens subsp. villosa TaxID=3103831 RepID=A0AAP0H1L0_9ASTR
MATDVRTQLMILEHSTKRRRLDHSPKLLPNQQVERPSHFPNYRGKIGPIPPRVFHDEDHLHFGQCVDVFVDDAWWESVVFDRDDDSDERLVLFPDLGHESRVSLKNLRVTQDWDATTDEWRFRGDWIFLEIVGEFMVDLPVFVKQIWYELKMTKCFVHEMKEWTYPVKENWKETVMEVMVDKCKLLMTGFLQGLRFPEVLDIRKKHFLDSNLDDISAIKSDYENLSVKTSDACETNDGDGEDLTNKNSGGLHNEKEVVKKDEALRTNLVKRSSERARKEVSPKYRTPRTVLTWLIENNIVLPRAKVQYCCKEDRSIMKTFTGLQRLLGKSVPVGKDNLTWTLRKNKTYEYSNSDSSDMEALIENYSKLNVAISVMHESFEPVKEPRSGGDIVQDVIFCKFLLPSCGNNSFFMLLCCRFGGVDVIVGAMTDVGVVVVFCSIYGVVLLSLCWETSSLDITRKSGSFLSLQTRTRKERGYLRMFISTPIFTCGAGLSWWSTSSSVLLDSPSTPQSKLGYSYHIYRKSSIAVVLHISASRLTHDIGTSEDRWEPGIDLGAESEEVSSSQGSHDPRHRNSCRNIIDLDGINDVLEESQSHDLREGNNNTKTSPVKCYRRRKLIGVKLDEFYQK